MEDFSLSSLSLTIKFAQIKSVRYYRIYKIAIKGLKLTTIKGEQNVFVIENIDQVKKMIEENIELLK